MKVFKESIQSRVGICLVRNNGGFSELRAISDPFG